MLTRKDFMIKSVQIGGTASLMLLPVKNLVAGMENTDNYLENLPSHLKEILPLAFRAPSGHNTQPWYIKVMTDNYLVLGLDKDRFLPAVDPKQRESILSLGALAESVLLAAKAMGYRARLVSISDNNRQVGIRILPGGSPEKGLEKKIRSRMTLRKDYEPESIHLSHLEKLTSHLSDFRYVPLNSDEGKKLSHATLEANRAQVYRDEAQAELSRWIRWKREKAIKTGNGLTPDTMEINGLAGLIVRSFYDQEKVMSESFRKTTIKMIEEQVSQGAGWLLLYSRNSSFSSLIQSGREYYRMLLEARPHSLAVHPMSQLLEEKKTASLRTPFEKKNMKLQFILRLGHREYPDPVSLRMDIDETVRL